MMEFLEKTVCMGSLLEPAVYVIAAAVDWVGGCAASLNSSGSARGGGFASIWYDLPVAEALPGDALMIGTESLTTGLPEPLVVSIIL